jgi:3'(2'), 5'-bisphosphate nucleotidase
MHCVYFLIPLNTIQKKHKDHPKKTMKFNNQMIYQAAFAAIEAGKEIMVIYGTDDFQVENKADESPLTIADKKAHEIIMKYLKDTGLPVLSEEGKEMPWQERSTWNKFWMVDPLDGTKEFIKRNGEFTVNIALIENHLPVLGIVYTPATGELFLGEVGNGAWKVNVGQQVVDILDFLSLPASKLPCKNQDYYGIVSSRSHMNAETSMFIDEISQTQPNVKLVSRGSSLKLCMIAEGEADIYPRFAPTMEWDTAAGHAVCKAAGAHVYQANNTSEELMYNKEDLLNPWFIATR